MNNPVKSFFIRAKLSSYRIGDGLYFFPKGNIKLLGTNQFDNFVFDLTSDDYVHLGDAFFFLPLIAYIATYTKVTVKVSGIKKEIFQAITHKNMNISYEVKEKVSALTISSPYLLPNYINRQVPFLGIGFFGNPTHKPYPLVIIESFLNFTGDSYDSNELLKFYESYLDELRSLFVSNKKDELVSKQDKYILVSPHIYSGRFRDLLNFKQKKIIRFSVDQSKQSNVKLLLVGGIKDSYIDLGDHFLDMRGHDIVAVMRFVASDSVLMGIGFDNFWMHFFDIIKKPYFVTFRGRFTKAARDIHYSSINVSFIRNPKDRIYI